MSPNSDGSLNPGADGPKPVRRRQAGVRTLIVLVAASGAILWAWRSWSENHDPALVEARSIQKRAIGTLRSGKPAQRLTAIVALHRLGIGDSSAAIRPLIGALEDPLSEVRVAAVEALESIGYDLVKTGSGGETVRAAMTALTRCLNDPEPAVRVAACKALGWIGSGMVGSGSGAETVRATVTALTRGLKDPDPGVRSAAVASLGKIASPRLTVRATPLLDRRAVMDAVVEMLGDRDAGVRRAAIDALAPGPGERGDPPKALAAALRDESAENREAAVKGLLFFSQGLDPWVPALVRLAEHDPDPIVRERCLFTLSNAFKPPAVTAAAVPVLAAGLSSADPKVRGQAAWILSALGADARAGIPELLRTLDEPLDPQVAPERSTSKPFDPACEAASALGQIAPGSAKAKEVIAALTEVARSGPVSRRGWAAVALGQFGPAAGGAVPVLIKVINEATPDDTFEHIDRDLSVVQALGMIAPGSPSAGQAVAALRTVLQSEAPHYRVAALGALARFGPGAAAAIPRIRVLKDDRDAEVRNAAAYVLRAIETEGPP